MTPGSDPRPVVSVLVPCWNAAGSLERALDSVLEERTVPLECIVVDDGSTDGTPEVARAVAARDDRVVVVALDENVGVSAARNRGLALVRGDWLTLLDADDRFLPGGLGTLAAAALRDGAAAIIGQQVWWDGRRRWRTRRYEVDDIRRPGRKSLAANPGLLNYVSPHAKLLHRDCWEGLRFEGRVLGDQPWIVRALLRAGDRIDVLGDTVYEWYRPGPDVRSGSITATTRASVDRGVEAIGVASEALAAVQAEAARLLDAVDAERVGRSYAERLLRSDLGAHIARALDRADPAIGRLFDAVEAFIVGLPPGYAAASDAIARTILEPPLRRWHRVPAGARPAFWRLLETATRLDPEVSHRAAPPLGPVGLGLAARPSPTGRALGAAILEATRLIGAVARRLAPRSAATEPDVRG